MQADGNVIKQRTRQPFIPSWISPFCGARGGGRGGLEMIPSSDERGVRAAFLEQGEICRNLEAHFTGRICELLAERLSAETDFGRTVLGWQGKPGPWNDALPLRVAAAFHALARRSDHPLGLLYPPAPDPLADDLWAGIGRAAVEDLEHLLAWLSHPPQTNEVGRSSALMAGLLEFASGVESEIDLFELGSSAGLNLHLDRYHHQLGGTSVGDVRSSLQLSPVWKGPSPIGCDFKIRNRRGVDLRPIDLRDPVQRERLASYVWAEHHARQEDLQKALSTALREAPLDLATGDAAGWLEEAISQSNDCCMLVFHSITWQYFDHASRRKIENIMAEQGERATPQRQLGWLSLEVPDSGGSEAALRLRVWPHGTDRLLAYATAHGRAVQWLSTARV